MADNYSSKEPDLISNIPDEILVHILENLCYCHSDKVSQVSTRFSIVNYAMKKSTRETQNPLRFTCDYCNFKAILYCK